MNTFIKKIPQIQIQKVSLKDVDDWVNILYESLRKTYSYYISSDLLIKNYNKEKLKENFINELNLQNSDMEQYILKLDGISVGILKIGKPIKYYSKQNSNNNINSVGEIKYLYIKSGYQCKGIGGQAISFAENRLKDLNYSKSSIWIQTKNAQAVRFCLTHGYSKTNYITPDTNNSMIVEKNLKLSTSNFDLEEIGSNNIL